MAVDYVNLCYVAAYSDPSTRVAMRNTAIPWLQREADDLGMCREACSRESSWAEMWESSGFVETERRIRAAIAYAQEQLASFQTSRREAKPA